MTLNPISAALAGPNILLMGPAGTGKTHSIGTLVDAGIEVFYLGLENGLEVLLGYWVDRGLPVPPNLHWHIVDAPKASFAEMEAMTKLVNELSLEALAKTSDKNRQKYDQMIRIYKCLNDFKCQRDGKSYGCVEDWDSTRALVIDGLTGINTAAMANVIGGRPLRSMPDWQLAQDTVEKMLRKLCDDCKCWFVLLAHTEREVDQVLGGVKLMPSTLGKALAPKLAPMFSDVVLTVREGAKWTWDCSNSMADIKARNLKWASGQDPSFKQIVDKWQARAQAMVPAG